MVLKALHLLPGASSAAADYEWDLRDWWHSEAGQDHTESVIFQGLRGGFFVDVAANKPIISSNTRALERDFGWHGICIDANTHIALNLAAGRSCSVVQAIVASQVSNTSDTKLIIPMGHNGLGHTSHSKDPKQCANCHRTATLEQILDELAAPRTIEYMSVDLEGYEDQALLGFPFDKYTILSLTVERPSAPLKERLTSAGFTFGLTQGWFGDELWLHSSLPGGVDQGQRRAKAGSAKWFRTAASQHWNSNRSGWTSSLPRHTLATKYACCGIPASFVRAGRADTVPSAEFEGRAPHTCNWDACKAAVEGLQYQPPLGT